MAAIRPEKFARPTHPYAQARIISPEEIEAIRKEAYENGIRDGAAAASDAFSTSQSQTLVCIEESINDAFLTREEAYRLALASFHPLVMSTAEALAPALARSGLAEQIADCVNAAVRAAPEDTLTVFVASELLKEASASFAQLVPKVLVAEDAELSTGQARIAWSDGFDAIDLNANAEAVLLRIRNFFTELERPEEMKA